MNSVESERIWINCAAVKAVYNHSRATGSTFLVLLTLATHANENGTAWPSVERLARLARVSVRTVQRALKQLQDLGEVTVVSAPGRLNVYRIEVGRDPSVIESQVEGRQSDGGVNLTGVAPGKPQQGASSGRGTPVNLAPEQIIEEKTNKPSPLPPSLDAATGREQKEAHPPAREDEEEVLKISQKAQAVLDALGPDLSSQLERLYVEKAPVSRFGLWLEAALYPQLERLGRSLFRAVIEQNLPAAAGSGIRYPSRFLVAKLEAEVPPPAPVSAAKDRGEPAGDPIPKATKTKSVARTGPMTMQELAAELEAALEAPSGQNQPKTEPAWRDAYMRRVLARQKRCRYGDHVQGDACCLPRALETLQRLAPAVGKTSDPAEREFLMPSLADAYRKVVSERKGVPEALEKLRETTRKAAMDVLGKLGVWEPPKPEPAPVIPDWAMPLIEAARTTNVAAAG